MISATIAGSLFAFALDRVFGNAVTGITTVGALPSHLPPLSLPDLSPDTIRQVAPIALANTILALTLAIGVGRSLGLRSGQRIDNNQEFIGQGISNIAGAFFSSFPSAGSFNRSAANYDAGAKTPLAAVYSSLFLVAIVLVVAPLVRLPALRVDGGDPVPHRVRARSTSSGCAAIARTSRTESAVMFVTLVAALFLGLADRDLCGRAAVADAVPQSGRASAAFSTSSRCTAAARSTSMPIRGLPDCPQLKILRVNGSIFFGAVEHVEDAFRRVDHETPARSTC